MVIIQFLSLSGPLRTVMTVEYPTMPDALAAVRAYAEPAGFTGVKRVDGDYPDDGFRFTARTPGGRAGRNVAFGDWI